MAEKNVVGSSGAGDKPWLQDPEKQKKWKAKEEARTRKRIAAIQASRAKKAEIMGRASQPAGKKDSDKNTEAEEKKDSDKNTEAEEKKDLVAERMARNEALRVIREAKKKDAEKKDAEKKKVLVPIANGTDAIEAVVTIDVLRRAGAKVTVASVESQVQVDFSYGVKIVADALLAECVETVFDLVAFPGGIPDIKTLKYCKTLENMVENQAAKNRHCAAICDAHAIAFGSRDLLTGMKATCSSFMELLSSIATATESRVEKDNNVVTSRGPGTAIEYAIALVEQLYDGKKATELSEELIVPSNHVEEYAFADLNPVTWTYAGSPQILVPVADGTEEMEVVIIVAVLRRAGAEVVVAFVEGKKEGKKERKKESVGNYDVKLVADMLLDEVVDKSFDLIVLPGELGGARTFRHSDKLIELLKEQKESNRPYGAICASPVFVFEDHGLLEGKKATAHPCMWDLLWDDSEAENRVVVDGYVATSQGPGTSMEYALVLVEKFFGGEKATRLAKEMVGKITDCRPS